MVDRLISQGVDLLALGEVHERDINSIRDSCNLAEFSIINGYTKAGRSHFDLCVLLRKSKLEELDFKSLTVQKRGRTLKLAQRIDLEATQSKETLRIYVSHWPSRLRQESDEHRELLGTRLRDELDKTLSQTINSGNTAPIILIGDYNDEPFSKSISEKLDATRDRDLCLKKKKLLYNPFWRKLGHEGAQSSRDIENYCAGSYFHKKGDLTRWRTFDQIIFTSAFVDKGTWNLNELEAGFFRYPDLISKILDPKEIFDHLPIFSIIEETN